MATIFNPAAFDPAASQDQNADKVIKSEKRPYQSTGVSVRDQIRKLLWEIFVGENAKYSTEKCSEIVEQVEDEIYKQFSDPKSRQYRDKARTVQLKLKGPGNEATRVRLLTNDLLPVQFCADSFLSGKQGSNSHATGPSKGPIRPGMPRASSGMKPRAAAPGQPVRARGGAPGMGRGSASARPRAPFRPPVFTRQTQPKIDTQTSGVSENQESSPKQSEIDPSPTSQVQFGNNDTPKSVKNGDQNQYAEPQIQTEQTPTHHFQQQEVSAQEEITPNQFQTSSPKQEEQSQQMKESQPQSMLTSSLFNPPSHTQDTETNSINQEPNNFESNAQIQDTQREESIPTSNRDSELTQRHTDHNQQASTTNQSSTLAQQSSFNEVSSFQDAIRSNNEENTPFQPEIQPQNDNNCDNMAQNLGDSLDTTTGIQDLSRQTIQSNLLDKNEEDKTQKSTRKGKKKKKKKQNRVEGSQPINESINEVIQEEIVDLQTSSGHLKNLFDPNPQFQVEEKPHITTEQMISKVDQNPPSLLNPVACETLDAENVSQKQKIESSNAQQEQNQKITRKQQDSQSQNKPNENNIGVTNQGYESPLKKPFMVTSLNSTGIKDPEYDLRSQTQDGLDDQQPGVRQLRIELQMINTENEALREELKKMKRQMTQSRQEQEESAYQMENQSAQMQLKLSYDERQLQQLRDELSQANQDMAEMRQNMQKQAKEGQKARAAVEERMNSALKNMGLLQNQESSTVLNTISPLPSNLTSQNDQIIEYQKELAEVKQRYEAQLSDKNQQLQMRVKEIQRLARQNVSLSEKNKQLSDTVQELQVQNLSTMAGSGSFQVNTQDNYRLSAQHLMQSAQNNADSSQQNRPASQNGGLVTDSTSALFERVSGAQTSSTQAIPSATTSQRPQRSQRQQNRNSGERNYGGLESVEAENGGRDDEVYFQDMTQDEGTGGESYMHQQQLNQSASGFGSSGFMGNSRNLNPSSAHQMGLNGASGGGSTIEDLTNHYLNSIPEVQSSGGGQGGGAQQPLASGSGFDDRESSQGQPQMNSNGVVSAGVGEQQNEPNSEDEDGNESQENDSEPERPLKSANHQSESGEIPNGLQSQQQEETPNMIQGSDQKNQYIQQHAEQTGLDYEFAQSIANQMQTRLQEESTDIVGLNHHEISEEVKNNSTELKKNVGQNDKNLQNKKQNVESQEDISRGEEGGCRDQDDLNEEMDQSCNYGSQNMHGKAKQSIHRQGQQAEQSLQSPENEIYSKNSQNQSQISGTRQGKFNQEQTKNQQRPSGAVVESGFSGGSEQRGQLPAAVSNTVDCGGDEMMNGHQEDDSGSKHLNPTNSASNQNTSDSNNQIFVFGEHSQFEEEKRGGVVGADNGGGVRSVRNNADEAGQQICLGGSQTSFTSSQGNKVSVQSAAGIPFQNMPHQFFTDQRAQNQGKKSGNQNSQASVQSTSMLNSSNGQNTNQTSFGQGVSPQQTNGVVAATHSQQNSGTQQRRVGPMSSTHQMGRAVGNERASGSELIVNDQQIHQNSQGAFQSMQAQLQRTQRRGNKQQFQQQAASKQVQVRGSSNSQRQTQQSSLTSQSVSAGQSQAAFSNQQPQNPQMISSTAQQSQSRGGAGRNQRGVQSTNQQQQFEQQTAQSQVIANSNQPNLMVQNAPAADQSSSVTTLQSSSNYSAQNQSNTQLHNNNVGQQEQAALHGSVSIGNGQDQSIAYENMRTAGTTSLGQAPASSTQNSIQANDHSAIGASSSTLNFNNGSRLIGQEAKSNDFNGSQQTSQLSQNMQSSSTASGSNTTSTLKSNIPYQTNTNLQQEMQSQRLNRLQQMPASHASNQGASGLIESGSAQSRQQTQGNSNSHHLQQPKGVVTTAGSNITFADSSEQAQHFSAGSGGGSGIIPEGILGGENNGGHMRSKDQNGRNNAGGTSASEIMNAESGSTAFTNSQQRNLIMSSPPSTSQTGGNSSSLPNSQNVQSSQSLHQNSSNRQHIDQSQAASTSQNIHFQTRSNINNAHSNSQMESGSSSAQPQQKMQQDSNLQMHENGVEFFGGAVGAPPSNDRAAPIPHQMQQVQQMGGDHNSLSQQMQQNQAQNTNSATSNSATIMQPQASQNGSSVQVQHQNAPVMGRYQAVASISAGSEQQSLSAQAPFQFVSGSGEQEEQTSQSFREQIQIQRAMNQQRVPGSSGANQSSNNQAVSGINSQNQQTPNANPEDIQQTMLMQGGTSSATSLSQAVGQGGASNSIMNQNSPSISKTSSFQNTSTSQRNPQLQSQQHSQQVQVNNQRQNGLETRKTSGANTPSKDGADTPPYRDAQPSNQNVSQIYIQTSKALQMLHQNQQESNQNLAQTSQTSAHQEATNASRPQLEQSASAQLQQFQPTNGTNANQNQIQSSNEEAKQGGDNNQASGQGRKFTPKMTNEDYLADF